MFELEIVESVATRVLARFPLGYGQEPCELFDAPPATPLDAAINNTPEAIAHTTTRFDVLKATLPHDHSDVVLRIPQTRRYLRQRPGAATGHRLWVSPPDFHGAAVAVR